MAALARAQQFARRYPFFLKLDIRKYFDSIPHEELLRRLARRFKDARLLDLVARIVGSFRGQVGRGITIGSLTSQHFANFYLGWFDRFAKEVLRIRGYVRYMDDMAFWSDDRGSLAKSPGCRACLAEGRIEFGAKGSPIRQSHRARHGLSRLPGFSPPHDSEPSEPAALAAQAKLAGKVVCGGRHGADELQERATAVMAFARTAGVSSWRFRQRRDTTIGGERPTGSDRVIRGGSWNNNGQNCRAANRNRNAPANRNNNLGFRLARTPPWRSRMFAGRNRPLSSSASVTRRTKSL